MIERDAYSYPQVVYDRNSLMPKPLDHSDLEAASNRFPNSSSRFIEEKDGGQNDRRNNDARRILGLRPATFWLSLALISAIIAIAVVGGVVGSLTDNSSNNGDAASHTVTHTATATATSPPRSSSSTPSHGIGLNFCTNGTIFKSSNGARFHEYCAIDWAQGSDAVGGGSVVDLTVTTKGSYAACMDGCASYNKQNSGHPCQAISFWADITASIPAHGGNCWYKNASGTATTLDGWPYPELYSVASLVL